VCTAWRQAEPSGAPALRGAVRVPGKLFPSCPRRPGWVPVCLFRDYFCPTLAAGRQNLSLAAFGAWLNPEVLLLFFLSVFQRCPRLRALLVVTILFSIPMTWIALNRMDHAGVAVYPLGPGHFLWITGILLSVFAESSAF